MFSKVKLMRLPVELEQIKKSQQVHGITCTITDDTDMTNLVAVIPGPQDSPYSLGKFQLSITFSEQYPFRPPTFKFVTPVFHPNIDTSGHICLDLLKMPPTGTYNPAITLESILLSIQLLLANPNPDDPLQGDAADLYKISVELFNRKAREHTEKYAKTADEATSKCEDVPQKKKKNS